MKPRGLSLLEAVVTLGVLFVAAGLLALVARQYARLLLWEGQADQSAFRLALVNQVADEIREATAIVAPSPGVQAGDPALPVHLQKVDPGLIQGLPQPGPIPWARDPSKRADVYYYLQPVGGRLMRDVNSSGGSSSLQVADRLSWFGVTRKADNELVVNVTFLRGDSLQVASRTVVWDVQP